MRMPFHAPAACLAIACLLGGGGARADNLIEDGGFETVKDINVGSEKYFYDALQEGAELTGGKGPIVRAPSNLSMLCGRTRLLVVEGAPGKEVHSGKAAVRLTGSCYLKGGGPAAGGDVFQVRLHAKGDGAVRLILPVEGKDGKSLGQAVPPPVPVKSRDWVLVEQTVDLKDYPGARAVGCRLEASGDVWIDDLSLTKLRSGPARGAAPLPVAFALRTGKAPAIDGKLDEECWAQASPNGPFVQLNNNGKTSEPTTFFRVAFDQRNVYFGIEAKEPELAAVKQDKQGRDSWPDGSSVEFFMDTLCDRSSYYQLAANLAGTLYDARKLDSKWNVDWQVAVQRAGDRWTMEVAMPFSGLDGGAPAPGAMWGFNMCRNREGGLPNSSTWAPVGASFHEPGRFNSLIFGTAQDWWARQLEANRGNSARLHARLGGLTPKDPALEAKLAAADGRLGAAAQPVAGLAADSPQFAPLYEELQGLAEDFKAIDQESEMAEAIQHAAEKTNP